ncbi:MAG: inorganic diphosphatase [Acholeplasmataceae bacterium]|jgi:inorganic pyrophosphatase|nr:inorganic diphosphatase [Acholeplasmataceae bacterium]MCK9234627.1 inorganic diphosphatase [Acholeplasmataceae bacterium]MCK9289331.1 inorganic diphosphatase [Acholeplasmataceae bacterium]MCK9427794.1 inorganic diphosphatase [Acholeplasmataceae bacterium]MDD4090173.1 inorganic diphosphatase [Acholeplasmataceae bacterium]
MNIWHNIDKKRIKPQEFISVVEIPKGSKTKYELDKETGMIILDRVLYTSTHYPANYGFIPRTYASDDDPLDVLVLCSENLHPLSLVISKPIGVISMIDSDQVDEKIIAVAKGDPSLSHYDELEDLPKHVLDEMHHFFEVYKSLENKKTYVLDIGNKEKAKETIQEAINRYNEVFK